MFGNINGCWSFFNVAKESVCDVSAGKNMGRRENKETLNKEKNRES